MLWDTLLQTPVMGVRDREGCHVTDMTGSALLRDNCPKAKPHPSHGQTGQNGEFTVE